MNILITICARGGSKGIPGKNIKQLNGQPLLAYTIVHAQAFAEIYDCDIALSTDDDKISDVAMNYGLHTTYKRPAELALDTTGKVPVITSLVNYEEANRGKRYDYIVDLDVSAPMRTLCDLLSAFALLKSDINALNIFSVSVAEKNPYFNMVEKSLEDNYYKISKMLPVTLTSRQEAPVVYAMNASFYIYTKSFFDLKIESAITSSSLIFEMNHESFDLDQSADFEYLDYLLVNNKLDFKIK